ncbi:hypothetical protein OPV22_027842 [Ensete ventricosum]|uniref:Bifunctional inhibitor/plant lipid transfer protein/seed storage helical domain-containing protein n=1 Tax=Ensete ventricosum TaxID=4639 RepID=A0AAV8Q8S2_ENSVE|nr:hypothetical protein OPV22_027842 [Ensete ventricosum]
MAGQAYFIAAMAVCFSMAPAVATTPGYNPCSFAELPIQYCKSFLQTGSHCSKPSLACCALVSDVFMVNPSCLCEAIKPSFLGVAVDPARVSLLPDLCHLPTKNLHCFAAAPSSTPIAHPPAASPPSSSISSPPSNPPSASIKAPSSIATSVSVAAPPSNAPSGSGQAPSSNPPSASVEAPSSSPPSGPVVQPPANAPSSSISLPPSNPPSSPIAAPPSSATSPASAPGTDSHQPATAPAAAPSSSDALKLATSLVVVLANLAFATAFLCSI